MSDDLSNEFINYMTLNRFSHHTKKSYLSAVEGLVKYYNQSPDTLTNDQIQEYFRHLLEDRKLSWGTCNTYFTGIISFYRNVCKWDETKFTIPPRPKARKLPVVFSMEEVRRLFDAASNLRDLALLKTVYSSGLRATEAARLRLHHIESDPSRMMIRVEQGKGRKDRYTVLSPMLLDDLRKYWKAYRPDKWLFPGADPERHLSYTAVNRAFTKAKKKPD